MRLQYEDYRNKVLSTLCKYHQLTTGQFYPFFSTTERTVRYYLKAVRQPGPHNKLLIKQVWWRKGTSPRNQPINEAAYRLTEHGLRLARDLGLDPDNLGYANDEKGLTTLNHEQEITNFHIALGDVLWRQRNIQHGSVNPDALFFLAGFYYFLEMEKSAKRKDLITKIENYDGYKRSKHFQAKWPDMQGFYLLISTKTAEKRDNLLKYLSEHHPYSFILVAAEEDWKRDIFGPIWYCPRDLSNPVALATVNNDLSP